MAPLIFVTCSSKGVSTSMYTYGMLLYTSCTTCLNLSIFCVALSHSNMIFLYSICIIALSSVTLTNSVAVDSAWNWISCVALFYNLCSTFNSICDNTNSMWLNSCTLSYIYVIGNSIDLVDIFMIRCYVDVDDGWDVIDRDSIVFVVLSICYSFVVHTGAILVASKIWHNVAICACTFMCISSYFYVAH